jgi:hypothetical protein
MQRYANGLAPTTNSRILFKVVREVHGPPIDQSGVLK